MWLNIYIFRNKCLFQTHNTHTHIYTCTTIHTKSNEPQIQILRNKSIFIAKKTIDKNASNWREKIFSNYKVYD